MRIVSTLLLLYSCSTRASTKQNQASSLRGPENHRRLANDLPWIGPNLSIGRAGLSKTLPPAVTAGASTVMITVNLSAVGVMEASGTGVDNLKIYYKIDENPEVLWKDIKGANFLVQESVTVPAGNLLTLRVNGKTTESSEIYYLSNFRVVDPNGLVSMPSPVSAPVPTAPIPSPSQVTAPVQSPNVAPLPTAPIPSPSQVTAPVPSPNVAPVPIIPTTPAVCSVPKVRKWIQKGAT